MVAAVQSLRLCARACSRAPSTQRIAAAAQRASTTTTSSRRPFSSTRAWRSDDIDQETQSSKPEGSGGAPVAPKKVTPRLRRSDKVVAALQEGMTEQEKETFKQILEYTDDNGLVVKPRRGERTPLDSAQIEAQAEAIENYFENVDKIPKELDDALKDLEYSINQVDEGVSKVLAPVKLGKNTFWGEDEEDPDYLTEDIDEEDFEEDDIMSLAHGKLEEHREYREYARIAAWQMPLLSKLARPFEPPKAEECLRFRYTTYMGENHPAQSKVVVEFSPKDLGLNPAQQTKLKKLLGARWNPETNIAKMSCEQFDHQAQNKRYLGDLVNKLVTEAKDPTDTFADIPLDTRHHQIKNKPKFPKEWYITVDRMAELEQQREKALLLDQAKEDAGSLVDGSQVIEKHYQRIEPVAIPARARGAPVLSQRKR
ncbi:37S ribosomal protein S24, mitochondrial [Pestalotiopsis sp. 9143b]|nr:37S ribosomal protein S24, mitochondrial [Pestalotiopsis sp. 9143b]